MLIRSLLLILCIIFLPNLHANIFSVDNTEEIKSITGNNITKNSLILIDIDDTLIIAHDKIMRNANMFHHTQFMDELKKQSDADHLINTVFQNADYFLLEEEFATLIEKWKILAHSVHGFTARSVGPFIIESNGEDWIANKLAYLGITFTPSSDILSNFKHGILFCGTQPKGEALLPFLTAQSMKFDSIVMIDDRYDNLKNVEESIDHWNELHTSNIRFFGFHYKAADYIDHSINPSVINKQLEMLITHKCYLSEWDIAQKVSRHA